MPLRGVGCPWRGFSSPSAGLPRDRKVKVGQVTEGKTKLFVPSASIGAASPPTSPVFFNPAASVNRDVTVAITEAIGGETFCDSLSGVGARGIRVVNEASSRIEATLVDFNAASLRLAERSAAANGVKRRCSIMLGDSRAFLLSRQGKGERFDYVDLDPFGSPAPYVQPALSAVRDGGVLSVTATDTAALCGVYPEVARRRYSATPLNNHFHHETAARILLNAVRREAGTLEKGIIPVAAHSTRHYLRVYARVEDGAAKADRALKNEGFVSVCSKCSDLESSGLPAAQCRRCGGRLRQAGPLWTGRLTDSGVLKRGADAAKQKGFRSATKILESQSGFDLFPPWSFSIEGVCSSLRVATVPEGLVRENLAEAGYSSGRQPFETTGLKTDAPYSEVLRAVKHAAKLA